MFSKMKIWCPDALNQECYYSNLYLTSHLISHTHFDGQLTSNRIYEKGTTIIA